MGDILLEFLPGLVFLVYIGAKIIAGLAKGKQENNRRNDPGQYSSQEKDEPIDLGQKVKDLVPKDLKEQKSEVEKKEEVTKKIDEIKQNKRKIRSSYKEKRDNNRSSRTGKKEERLIDFERDQELVKAVMYKEILDKPRAKNPYRPPNLR